ncbi:MAG TPA: ABC transporter permease [Candidatus Binatia bacterium]|nr:ABC transporter permease [Candidatus Binatia bacterium]
MWSGNFKTALSSLRQSKWRSMFTMLGIIIGISSVVTIVSLGEGLKHQIVGQVTNLGSNVVTVRPGKLVNQGPDGQSLNLLALFTASTLSSKDVQALNGLTSATDVVPIDFVTSSARGDNGQIDNIFVAGTNSQFPDIIHQDVAYGEFFPPSDDGQYVAVIGPAVATKLFGTTNAVGSTIYINGQGFIIHGVLNQSSDSFLSVAQADLNSAVLIPFTTATQLTGGATNILQIFIKTGNSSEVNQTIDQATALIVKNHGQQDFSVLKQQELLNITSSLVNSATSFISAIAAISLLVGGIGIMDIMLVSVSERNREIGIRKAVGATNRQILSQFLTEGLALTIAGGIIGIALSFAINAFLRLYTSWHPIIDIWVVVLAAGISIAVGVLFSIAPAIKAASKDPIEALRGD